jgi:dolichyl-phosphate beta-glucosyltransferase
VSLPELSIVIPAFNEEQRLPRTLRTVTEYLEDRGEQYEIVVVDDGSTDRTVAAAQEAASARLTLLTNDVNRGKGYSVRRGMLAARGARRLMSDADLSTPIEELPRLLALLDDGYDIAIGSRALAGARIEVHQPRYREIVGRLFNRMARVLAVRGLADTQCGFKLFNGPAAVEVFQAARLDGFSFDVEALFIAQQRGFRIVETPVIWRNDAATRVTMLRGWLAFLDLVRIRLNAVRGRYRRQAAGQATPGRCSGCGPEP